MIITLIKTFLILLISTITTAYAYTKLDPAEQAKVEDKWIHYLVLFMAVQALLVAIVT